MHDPILRRWRFAVGGVLVCAGVTLVVVGCFGRLGLSDLADLPGRKHAQPPTMSDCAALQEPDLACTLCHRGAETEAEAGMPDLEICMSCHAGLRSVGLF